MPRRSIKIKNSFLNRSSEILLRIYMPSLMPIKAGRKASAERSSKSRVRRSFFLRAKARVVVEVRKSIPIV